MAMLCGDARPLRWANPHQPSVNTGGAAPPLFYRMDKGGVLPGNLERLVQPLSVSDFLIPSSRVLQGWEFLAVPQAWRMCGFVAAHI
jgi:hypothetical protein